MDNLEGLIPPDPGEGYELCTREQAENDPKATYQYWVENESVWDGEWSPIAECTFRSYRRYAFRRPKALPVVQRACGTCGEDITEGSACAGCRNLSKWRPKPLPVVRVVPEGALCRDCKHSDLQMVCANCFKIIGGRAVSSKWEPRSLPVVQAIPTDFEARLDVTLAEVRKMLLAKNKAYGNSALEPVRIFSKASTEEQLRVRIDDKLSRLARGSAAGEDVTLDLLGYLLILRMAGTNERQT